MRGLRLAFRGLSYLALAVVLGGIAAMALVDLSGACPRFDEGSVQCVSPAYAAIAGTGLFIVLMSAFTVVPALLALAGVVFLLRDVTAWAKRRRTAAPVRRT